MDDLPSLDSEKLYETLALLKEARDLLSRMPFSPVVMQFVQKIDAHLANPDVRMLAAREARAPYLAGGWYTPAGLPLLEAEVRREQLYLKCMDYPPALKSVYSRLTEGFALDLKSVDEHRLTYPPRGKFK
ncbi:hypothetical protein [Comamonas thiooxydans]|uniref:hypothetical protein n=1 Tax=Comamonas thiooxydans TaxID=363952 RepID=UPI000B407725|nr:hypothetical protein [Comamonas thiooxydans]